MNRKRIAVLAVLAILLAVPPLSSVVVPRALAKATQIRMPVTFTLNPAQCPNLLVTVEGMGESYVVINHRIDKDGVDHININTLATGSAIDSDGANYGFNYHSHASYSVAPGGFPFQVTTYTDHFNLEGEGKANQVHVGFVVRATFTSPSDPGTFEFVNMRGTPFFCDPI